MISFRPHLLAFLTIPLLAHGQAAQPPVISSIGPQKVSPGATLIIPFQASSPVLPGSALSISGRSSDQTLVRDSDIIFSPGFGEFGNNRTLTLTAQGNTPGITTITLIASDGITNASTSFQVTVWTIETRPRTNSNPISILDDSVSDLYPSVIDITAFNARITRLRVTLYGFNHSFPSDVGVLLVGPNGQKVVLMNGAGGGHPGATTNLSLTFDQDACCPIPTNGPMASGSFTPSNYGGVSRIFLKPAPPGPYTNSLADFRGISPNGRWALYVQDFETPDAGSIGNGWGLTIDSDSMLAPDFIIGRDRETLTFALSVGTPNSKFRLYTSKDLTTWTDTGLTTTIDTNGSAQIKAPLSRDPDAAFFRLDQY